MILFFIVYGHETIHSDIAKNHGCVNSTIEFHWTHAFMTCHKYSYRTMEMKLQEEKLHSINELVTYNMIVIYFLIIVIKELK